LARRAIFVDRDGILNRERRDYVKTPQELEVLDGVERPIKEAHEKGFLIVVTTNQSAVGRGITTHEALAEIHAKMRAELEKRGCSIDAIYYCPHSPDDRCGCRKPQPGLILRAAEDLAIDLKKSWLIGDKESDVEAARRAGCRGVMVPSNGGGLELGMREILTKEHHGSKS